MHLPVKEILAYHVYRPDKYGNVHFTIQIDKDSKAGLSLESGGGIILNLEVEEVEKLKHYVEVYHEKVNYRNLNRVY